ncbi:putative tail protein GpU [Pseudomonas phage PPpW-3]|uniref:Putative tail protein GpU n=1 Tax=Pseudomonas phage PPpW-3 TaxID=1279082 RepID=V5YTC2_9CAUD|nr:tail protein [Pseudomonas phage PPpW-3]BAO20622.1 putative tail protein GpU [Pseudomonas phage PPpW-3]
MIGHRIGASVMLQLGSFQFSIRTAAYQELTRESGHRWAAQDLYGREPGLQYTGPESQTMALSGVIYTEYRGGTGQLNALRNLAAGGMPLNLVEGSGRMLGRWVIERVQEKQAVFADAGLPRKQEFTVQLKKFPADAPGFSNLAKVAGTVAAGVSKATGATGTLSSAKSAVGKFVENAGSAVGSAITSMNTTLGAMKDKATEIGNGVGPVVATVSRGISSARALQNQVANLKESLQNMNSLGNIQSAVIGVMSAASAASNAGAVAAAAAGALGVQINVPAASPSAVQAVNDCGLACGRTAVTSAGIYNDADSLVKSITSASN